MLSNAAFNAFLKPLKNLHPMPFLFLQQQKKIKLFQQYYPDVNYDFNRIEIDDIKNRLKKIPEQRVYLQKMMLYI